MKLYRKIVGVRVYLSPFDAEDAEMCAKWAEWMNDEVIGEYYGGTNRLVSLSSAKSMFAEFTGYRFTIALCETDEAIGHVSLHNVDNISRTAFLGIFIGDEDKRGRGYGSEAIRLALGYGYGMLNLNNVALTVHADNSAAIACYEKIGFRECGRQREWVFKNGKYVDKLCMELLEREF